MNRLTFTCFASCSYPVHCAVLGGSLQSLKWLVDEHCCPLRSLRVGGRRQSRGSYTPILTSRGRSLLGIAMENQNLEIVRYLVADKNMSLTEEKGLALETTIRTLEAALKRLPADADGTIPDVAQTTTTDSIDFVPTQVPAEEPSSPSQTAFPTIPPQETSPSSTNGTSGAAASIRERDEVADNGSTGTVDDAVSAIVVETFDVRASCVERLLTRQSLFLSVASASFALQTPSIVSLRPVGIRFAVCNAVLILLDAPSVK